MSWKDKYREQLEERDDSPFYKLVSGTNVFRVLPNFNWVMSDDPGEWPTVVEYLKHKNVGPKERLVACGKTIDADGTQSGSCFLCDVVIPKYAASHNEKERGHADAMHPVPFSVLQVSPLKNGKFMPPKTLEIQVGGDRSWGGKVMNYLLRPDRFYEHPLKGRNFVVVKKVDPAKKGPSATSYPIVEVEEEATKVPRAIFDLRKPFEDLLPVYDEAEQRAALKGEDYQRSRESGGWNVPDEAGASDGYDETQAGDAEAEGWAEAGTEEDGSGWDTGEGEAEYEASAEDGYAEEGTAEEGYGEEVTEDGAGWDEAGAEAEVGNEEWPSAPDATDGWDDTPAAPVVKKGPAPPVKKGPPPAAPVKKGPPPAAAPVRKGPPPAPPTRPAGPPVKKGAPPPPPPPVRKGPPPAPPLKKGPPPAAPVRKGPPPPVKKGPPPPRR